VPIRQRSREELRATLRPRHSRSSFYSATIFAPRSRPLHAMKLLCCLALAALCSAGPVGPKSILEGLGGDSHSNGLGEGEACEGPEGLGSCKPGLGCHGRSEVAAGECRVRGGCLSFYPSPMCDNNDLSAHIVYTKCDEPRCYRGKGSSCDGETLMCHPDFVCFGGLCRAGAGQHCVGRSRSCGTGLVCNEDDKCEHKGCHNKYGCTSRELHHLRTVTTEDGNEISCPVCTIPDGDTCDASWQNFACGEGHVCQDGTCQEEPSEEEEEEEEEEDDAYTYEYKSEY